MGKDGGQNGKNRVLRGGCADAVGDPVRRPRILRVEDAESAGAPEDGPNDAYLLRNLRQTFEAIEREPIPQRLRDLLDRLGHGDAAAAPAEGEADDAPAPPGEGDDPETTG